MSGKNPSNLFVPTIILIALAIIIAVTRLQVFNEPMRPDIAFYAVTAHEIGKGRQLYTDLWCHGPPAIFSSFLAAEKMVGYGPAAVYGLSVIVSILTLFGVFFAGKAVGGIRGGLWAAVFWTLIGGDVPLEANQPNVEVFLNALVVWMFALTVTRKNWSSGSMLAFGLLGAIASLYKPQALCWICLIPVADTLLQPSGTRMRFAVKAFLKMVFPTFGVWIFLLCYFAVTRPWQDVWDTLFFFNVYYSQNVLKNLVDGFSFEYLLPHQLWFVWPLAILAIWGSVRLYRNNRRIFWLGIAYFSAVYLGISSVGTFWTHYYQYWLPGLAISAGWAIGLDINKNRWIVWGVGCAVSAVLLVHEACHYRLYSVQWNQQKYQTEGLPEDYRLGVLADEVLARDETFYVFGDGVAAAQAYFVSRRSPPSGVFNIYPALLGNVRITFKLRHRLMTQLKKEKPEMIAFELSLTGYHKLFEKNYNLWGFFPEDKTYLLMVREGGALEKRLQKAGAGNVRDGIINPAPKIPMSD